MSTINTSPLQDRCEETGSDFCKLVASSVSQANGKRRVRTLSYAEVLALCDHAIETGEIEVTGGGSVANAYKYSASQTAAVAFVLGGRLYCGVAEASAKKGASLYSPHGGNKSFRDEKNRTLMAKHCHSISLTL